MKICITGHTSGIGKALQEYFLSNGHEVLGFSRSNNFDISNSDDRKKIIEVSSNADIFINNAYNFSSNINHQLILFNQLYASWKDSEKIIFNISSTAGDFPESGQMYNNNKHQLDEMNRRINQYPTKVHVVNIKPSYTDTPLMQRVESEKLNAESIVSIIDFIISFKDKGKITFLTVYPNFKS